MSNCVTPQFTFGQPVLNGVQWPIQLNYDSLFLSGIIGAEAPGEFDANGQPIINPWDLTSCQLDSYINDDEGNLLAHWSSGGINPAFTLFTGSIDYPNPNWQLDVSNAALNIAFPEGGNFVARWVFTDSLGTVTTLWLGTAQINDD